MKLQWDKYSHININHGKTYVFGIVKLKFFAAEEPYKIQYFLYPTHIIYCKIIGASMTRK